MRYFNAPLENETAEHSRPDGQAWGIRFPGMVNPLSGEPYDDANFFPEKLHEAADFYRGALRVDLFNETAANGLLRTYYERIAVYTYAGHNSAERSARQRLISGNIQEEIVQLESGALKFYTDATDELNLFTSRYMEAQLFDGSYPYIASEAIALNRNRILEAYTRALAHQAETVAHIGKLKQFSAYRNPCLIKPRLIISHRSSASLLTIVKRLPNDSCSLP